MDPTEMLWRGVAVPVMLAFLILLPALMGRVRGSSWGFLLPVAIAAGYLAGHYFVIGWPRRIPPIESRDFMPFVVGAMGIVGAAIGVSSYVGAARLDQVVRWGVAIGLPWLLLRSYVKHWTPLQISAHLSLIGFVLFVTWGASQRLAEVRRGATVPLGMTLILSVTAICLGLSGTALFAQLTGVLAAASGVSVIAAWVDRDRSFQSAVPVWLVPLSVVLITGYFYAELTLPVAALLAMSPLLLWIRLLMGEKRPVLAVMATMAILVLDLAVALFLAHRDFTPLTPGQY